MIFKKIGNMENVEAICHYLASHILEDLLQPALSRFPVIK